MHFENIFCHLRKAANGQYVCMYVLVAPAAALTFPTVLNRKLGAGRAVFANLGDLYQLVPWCNG